MLGYLATHAHLNIWPAIAIVFVFGAAVGLLNGYTVVRTKLPSFIVTLATFFVLQGINAALTLKLTGQTAIENIDSASGFDSAYRFFASDLTSYAFKTKVLWWIGHHDRRGLAAREDPLRQLDLRRRRRARGRAQHRRARRAARRSRYS